jgi:hypothetical protein
MMSQRDEAVACHYDEIEFDEFAEAARVGSKMLLELLMTHHGRRASNEQKFGANEQVLRIGHRD